MIRLGITLFTLFFSTLSWAASQELQVFFIHGLNGSENTFCDMPVAVEDYFSKQGFSIRTKALSYSTKSEEGTLYFVEEIKEQIVKHYQDNNLSWDTPYSFVVHSQGGIVGLKYLYRHISQCYDDSPEDEIKKQKNCPVPYNFLDFVSFGSPFWGSQGANTSQNKLIDFALKYSGQYKQLEQLRIGSLSLGNSRRKMLERVSPNDGVWEHPIRGSHKIKFHNLVGEINSYVESKPWSINHWLLGGRFQEFDIIVSPSGGRIDFNYVLEHQMGDKVVEGKTQLGHSYYAAPMGHMDLSSMKFRNTFPDVNALANMTCKKGTEIYKTTPDKHLAFHFTLSVLNNYFSDSREQPVVLPDYSSPQGLNNFFVDMQIHLPMDLQRMPRFSMDNVTIAPKEPSQFFKPVLKAGQLIRGVGFNNNASDLSKTDKKYISFFHDGRFDDQCCDWNPIAGQAPPRSRLFYSFQVPGFKTKVVDLPVEVSFSTFAKIYLEPYRPFPKELKASQFVQKEKGNLMPGDYIIAYYENGLIATVDLQAQDPSAGLNLVTFNPHKSLERKMKPKCFVGLTAESFLQKVTGSEILKTTSAFNNVFAEEASGQLHLGTKVKVLGRYYRKANHAGTKADVDRYFVAIPRWNNQMQRDIKKYGQPIHHLTRGFGGIVTGSDHLTESFTWLNVNDVDIIEGASCQSEF